eukprot:2028284-Rhodomonas_salina.1
MHGGDASMRGHGAVSTKAMLLSIYGGSAAIFGGGADAFWGGPVGDAALRVPDHPQRPAQAARRRAHAGTAGGRDQGVVWTGACGVGCRGVRAGETGFRGCGGSCVTWLAGVSVCVTGWRAGVYL